MQGHAAGHPREHDSRRRDDGARRGRARRRARLPSVDARRRRPGAPRRQAAGALRGGAPAEGRMVRQPPLARTVRGWRAARDRRRAHGAQTGGRRGPDRRGGECARSARPRVRRAHAAGRSHGASRRARPPRQPPLARPLGGPARPRDADVRDVLPGDDVRSRAAPDPGRRARGQPDDRRARTRRPALARHELSLSALSGERRPGGAGMTDEVMARAVGGPHAGFAGAAGTGSGSAGDRRGPHLHNDVIPERLRRPRLPRRLPGASAAAGPGNPLVYLDSAASSQRPRTVIEAMSQYYARSHANVHRSIHTLGEEATELYEAARDRVQRFIGAGSREEVVFTRGTTDGLSLLAETLGRTLRAGDEVLITELEHHSNIIPWQLATRDRGAVLKAVPLGEDGTLDLEAFERLLTPRTRVVAFAHVSNVLGTINPG